MLDDRANRLRKLGSAQHCGFALDGHSKRLRPYISVRERILCQQHIASILSHLNTDSEIMGAESTLEDPGFLNPTEFELVMRQQLDLYIQVC